jgi:hypothetical protein
MVPPDSSFRRILLDHIKAAHDKSASVEIFTHAILFYEFQVLLVDATEIGFSASGQMSMSFLRACSTRVSSDNELSIYSSLENASQETQFEYLTA